MWARPGRGLHPRGGSHSGRRGSPIQRRGCREARQQPGSGASEMASGESHVDIAVSLVVLCVTVPDDMGMPRAAAETAIAAEALLLTRSSRPTSICIPPARSFCRAPHRARPPSMTQRWISACPWASGAAWTKNLRWRWTRMNPISEHGRGRRLRSSTPRTTWA